MHNARAFSKADGTEGLAREPEDIQVACRRSLIVAGGQVFVEAHRRAAVPLVQQVPHVARHLRGEDVLVRNAQHFERETCRARSRLRQNEVEENKLKSEHKKTELCLLREPSVRSPAQSDPTCTFLGGSWSSSQVVSAMASAPRARSLKLQPLRWGFSFSSSARTRAHSARARTRRIGARRSQNFTETSYTRACLAKLDTV